MKWLTALLLITIAIQLVSCSSAPDVTETEPANQEQQISDVDEKDQEQPTPNEGDSSAQEVEPVEVMDSRPSLYYRGTIYDIKHYDGNKIDVTDFNLKYIGDMNYVGIKMSQDLDTNDDSTKGSAVYTAKEQLVGLIYHCSHCGEYFSIFPE